jgi:hypothetical protein
MRAVYANNTGPTTFARKLARGLGIAVVNSGDTLTRPVSDWAGRAQIGWQFINWGSSYKPNVGTNTLDWVSNTPEAVHRMSNKLHMFRAFRDHDIPCLEWTDDRQVALGWLDEDVRVYERHKLTGHSGEGIAVKEPNGVDIIDRAPLYTKDLGGKFREYRIHVVNRTVVMIQLKRKMGAAMLKERGFEVLGEEERRIVRTYKNGWSFCVKDFDWPVEAQEISLRALQACGAESGAVDVAVKCSGTTVIETNSAPALRSPTVLAAYVAAYKKLMGVTV